jgi:5S rRNA maturation endonuclease (ribonuclease M5)
VVVVSRENIEELRHELAKLKQSGKLVVVEGLKDGRSLAKFGLKNIMALKKPIYAVVDNIAAAAKECAILTDLDSEGKKLYGALKKELQKQGVKIDDKLRNFISKNTPVKHIEGLATFLENHFKQKGF